MHAEAREAAQKAYRPFRENPKHPSLQFTKVHDREPVYSVRITVAYRAVGILENDEVTWFWIGHHAEYERLISNLYLFVSAQRTAIHQRPLRVAPASVWCNGRLDRVQCTLNDG